MDYINSFVSEKLLVVVYLVKSFYVKLCNGLGLGAWQPTPTQTKMFPTLNSPFWNTDRNWETPIWNDYSETKNITWYKF